MKETLHTNNASINSHGSQRIWFITVISLLCGMMLGFFSFDHVRQSLVQESLTATELQHNESLVILLDRLDLMKGELQECLEDDSQSVEAAELRGKLAAHLDLETKNQQLLEELETTHHQLDEAVRALHVKEEEYAHLGEIVDKQVADLDVAAKESAELKERSSSLSQQRNSMARKIKALNAQVEMLNAKVEDYDRQIDSFKNRIQLREAFNCKEE